MNTEQLDMNLLRLFEAVYRLGSVSRAADALGLSQPAASQGRASSGTHAGFAVEAA